MKFKIAIILLSTFFFTSFTDVEVEGEKFPNEVTYNKTKLIFNGGGVREKMWIDLYVAALYLKTKQNDRSAILKNNNTIAIKIKIVSDLITKEKMEIAVEEGFDNSLGAKKKSYRKEIDLFKSTFKDGIVSGDKFDFVYVHGKGVSVYKNGIEKATVNKEGFKEGLFDIWIGDVPVQENLRDALLGK